MVMVKLTGMVPPMVDVHAIGKVQKIQIIAPTERKMVSVTRNVILEPANLTGETVGLHLHLNLH